MGHTHYYRQKRDMTVEEFEGFKKDSQKILEELPKSIKLFNQRYANEGEGIDWCDHDVLAVEHDEQEMPMVAEDWVHFNGAGFDGADHESFVVDRWMDRESFSYDDGDGTSFNFTKTNKKPYDVAVCACLLALKGRAPTAWELSSDGVVGEWAAACKFAQDVLGKKMPLSKVSSFGKCKEAVEHALMPTPYMVAKQEQKALSKAVEASKPRAKPSL